MISLWYFKLYFQPILFERLDYSQIGERARKEKKTKHKASTVGYIKKAVKRIFAADVFLLLLKRLHILTLFLQMCFT